MEIALKASYGGYDLIITAENVRIEEDVEERIYPKKEDGKPDFKQPPVRDVSAEAITQICKALEDMIYHRKAEIDTSSLIGELFDKLPEDVARNLAIELHSRFTD